MAVTSSTAVDTAATFLALSKTTWRLGIALSGLEKELEPDSPVIKDLAGNLRSFSSECDLLYTRLEELADRYAIVPPRPYDNDDELWVCLTAQVSYIVATTQELERVVQRFGQQAGWTRAQRVEDLDRCRDQIVNLSITIARHTHHLTIALSLIDMTFTHPTVAQDERQMLADLRKLETMVNNLGRASDTISQPDLHSSEASLAQYARVVIAAKTRGYGGSTLTHPAANRHSTGPPPESSIPSWLQAIGDIRRDLRDPTPTHAPSSTSPRISVQGKHTIMTRPLSGRSAASETKSGGHDSDSDLDTDLAKAALDTGRQAFEARDWREANTLFQEALRLLRQLPTSQREICEIFDLHYRLAICTFHTETPLEAEKGLTSLIEIPAVSDDHHECRFHAMHLLAQLYIHMGQVDRARVECELALQGRRKLLGKQSPAALESIALMAHIYVILDNRALAKSYLAMVPEARRDAVLASVEQTLGTKVEHLDFASVLTRATSEESDVTVSREHRRLSSIPGDSTAGADREQARHVGSPLGLYREDCDYNGEAATLKMPMRPRSIASSASSPSQWSPYQQSLLHRPRQDDGKAERIYPPSTTERSELIAPIETSPPEPSAPPTMQILSRREILDKVGCQPRNKIEEAVCTGDLPSLSQLLSKRKGFWRSSLRKRGRPERVTALHFAALFGEINMARSLLTADFNINEVPFGYSTSLTPLHFAIGARQVAMVDFLLASGARPPESDTWASLAGQLMSRAWLIKTMSEADREFVSGRMIAIFALLMKYGWDVNAPFGANGGTVLHQAVVFWTGSYAWDLKLRAEITSFLCEQGADPRQANTDGKTPHDLALASGHQDLVLMLDECAKSRALVGVSLELVELPGQMCYR